MAYLGESIPKLGFGLMRLPKLDDETIDIEQVKQMVDLFMEAGCTYYDTARAYTGSEAAIRKALVERYPRESFQLATKNAAWIKAKDAAEAQADFYIWLEETGAGYFDFYLIHNTGGPRTAVFDKFGMWDFVKQLKADGKVKHIGFSHHDNAERLDEVITAHPEMEFVQLQVNYADWDNANMPRCCALQIPTARSLIGRCGSPWACRTWSPFSPGCRVSSRCRRIWKHGEPTNRSLKTSSRRCAWRRRSSTSCWTTPARTASTA